MNQAPKFSLSSNCKNSPFINLCHNKAICIHKSFSMKYFDTSEEVFIALFKSFFSKCALNFLTKLFVVSMF